MFTLIILVPLLLHIGNGKGLPAHTCETLPVTKHEYPRVPLIKCCGYDFIRTNISTSTADHDLQVDIYDKETLSNISIDQFVVSTRKPCSVVFELKMDADPWYVQENGFLYHPTVAFEHGNPYTEPGDFCLHPREDSEIVEVHLCVKEVMREQSEKLQSSKHMRFVFFMRSLFIISEDLRLFLACIHCGKLANVLKEISKINAKFNSGDIWFGSDSFPRRIWIQIGVGIPLLAARISLSPLLEPTASIIVRTTCCIAFLIHYMGCCQFCAYACLLKDLFNLINQSLKERKAHDLKDANSTSDSLHATANEIGLKGGSIYQFSKFSMQMIPIKSEIIVCGMFNLDYQIILSMIVASTSYLVIMVQFDEGNPCE
ncbi:hypothetical protein CBL_14592 [Carabus blaptoides fortunei]